MDKLQFHPSVLLAWKQANLETLHSGCSRIEPVHFLIGSMLIIDGLYGINPGDPGLSSELEVNLQQISDTCLSLLGLKIDEVTKLRRKLQNAIRSDESPLASGLLHRSNASRQVFSKAADLAVEQGCSYLSLDYLVAVVRKTLPVNLFDLPDLLAKSKLTHNPDWASNVSQPLLSSEHSDENDILGAIGKDLTDLARSGNLREVVGREREISTILRILLRTTKRNVILIGEAGAGKTAVVEGLAQYLVSGNVPKELKKTRIIQMAVSDLVAGTMYRGMMETRLKNLIHSIEQEPGTVLFLDEIHLAVHSGGSGDGAMDIANILKPALTRGSFPCIGATTTKEYEKYLANDEAFTRRFHVLKIEEPDEIQTLKICRTWAASIEKRIGVAIGDEAIRIAVELSNQFILDRHQPDKAIDLLEDTATMVRMKYVEVDNNERVNLVGGKEVRTVLEEQLGIKIDGLVPDPIQIKNALESKLIGQAFAIDQIKSAFEEIRSKSQTSYSRNGVFLFRGPTSSGKMEAAQAIAYKLFPNSNQIFKIDLSEYNQDQDITRLTGAPPGFIGFDQQGLFLKFAFSVSQGAILLQGIEKAARSVQEFIAHILEHKEYLDSKGRLFNFRNHLFILTCNTSSLESAPKIIKEVDRHCDWSIEFDKIDLQDFIAFFNQLFESLTEDINKRNIKKIEFGESSRMNIVICLSEKEISKAGFTRLFEQQVTKPIMKFVNNSPGSDSLQIVWIGNRLEIIGDREL
jgi:ATP-dependent Clp protease ATP-binding subunit ClpA